MTYTTTLSALRAANACERGYDLIANHIGRDYEGTIPLETILDVNGLDDCIWSLRATEGGHELAVAFAIYCAEPNYTAPDWVRWATDWMNGADRSTDAAAAYAAAYAAYAAARAAAYAAAAAAARAAAYAAYAAAYAAARAAAYAAARAAAHAAAYAAASTATYAAADAARAAERQRQTEILRKLVKGVIKP